MRDASFLARLRRWGLAIGALTVISIILWLDISSGLWQEVVILSGLAAGLVTFLLTVLVLDRVMARSTARRWAPVNRLAFSAFLHALADSERGVVSRGELAPRSLPHIQASPESAEFLEELHELREQVVQERELLSEVLSRWAEFLASSGDNEAVLTHIAEITIRLDVIRDFALDAENARDAASLTALTNEIDAINLGFSKLIDELQSRIATDTASIRKAMAAS